MKKYLIQKHLILVLLCTHVPCKLYMTRHLTTCLQDVVPHELENIGIESNTYYDIFVEQLT